jgi:hypothetical protein
MRTIYLKARIESRNGRIIICGDDRSPAVSGFIHDIYSSDSLFSALHAAINANDEAKGITGEYTDSTTEPPAYRFTR